jgi:hypothetical protein
MSRLLVLANEATAAQRRVYFHLVDATDGITAETTEAGGQPQVSSDGGAWTNTGISTLTAIGNGRYYADLTQTLVQTAGTLIETRYKSANTAECPGDSVQVVAFDPNSATDLGLSSIADILTDTGTTLQAELDDLQTRVPAIVRENTALGGSSTTIELDASASAVENFYQGMWIVLTGGTGAGQTAQMIAYDATFKIASVPAWAVNPAAGTTFRILQTPVPAGVRLASQQSVGDVTGNVSGNILGSVNGSVGSVAIGGITAASIANGAIDAATFAADVDAEARSWLGLASANLDTQLADLPTVAEFEARTLVAANYATASALDAVDNFVDTEVAAIQTTLANLFTTALSESYRSAGAAPTMAQFAFETLAQLGDASIASTTKTIRNLAGTAAKTFTLDSATTPTSITETT